MTQYSTKTNVPLKIKNKAEIKNIKVYDQETNDQIFGNVQYIDASVTDDKKMMEHPIEDGSMIIDHIVNDPKQVSMQLLISDDDYSSLNELLDYYYTSSPVVIKVKNEVFTDLVMSSKPLKVDTNYYDKTTYDLTFKEVQVAVTQYVKMSVPKVKNKKNASKVKVGRKQSNNSALFDIVKGKIKL